MKRQYDEISDVIDGPDWMFLLLWIILLGICGIGLAGCGYPTMQNRPMWALYADDKGARFESFSPITRENAARLSFTKNLDGTTSATAVAATGAEATRLAIMAGGAVAGAAIGATMAGPVGGGLGAGAGAVTGGLLP